GVHQLSPRAPAEASRPDYTSGTASPGGAAPALSIIKRGISHPVAHTDAHLPLVTPRKFSESQRLGTKVLLARSARAAWSGRQARTLTGGSNADEDRLHAGGMERDPPRPVHGGARPGCDRPPRGPPGGG